MSLIVKVGAVVHSRHVSHLCKTSVKSIVNSVHTVSDRTSGIELAYLFLKMTKNLCAILHTLLRNLVTHAPHHDTWMQAVGTNKVLDVTVAPLVEETGIAVLALRINPHVKALCHDHHTE